MPARSGRPETAPVGRWPIVEMDTRAQEDADVVAPGFIEFAGNQTVGLGFIAVPGGVYWRHESRAGRPGVESSRGAMTLTEPRVAAGP